MSDETPETERLCPRWRLVNVRRAEWRSVDPLDRLKRDAARERLDRARDHLLRLLAESVAEILTAAALPNSNSQGLCHELLGQVHFFVERRKELDEGVDPDVIQDDGGE